MADKATVTISMPWYLRARVWLAVVLIRAGARVAGITVDIDINNVGEATNNEQTSADVPVFTKPGQPDSRNGTAIWPN